MSDGNDRLIKDKQILRTKALKRRLALSEDERQKASAELADMFFKQNHFQNMKSVAGYAPIKNEIDPLFILYPLHQKGVQCALPAILDNRLIFRPIVPKRDWRDMELTPSSYGFLEPKASQKPITPDLLLIPLLAFDLSGGRLGYGAGHYDGFLANPAHRDILTIGIGFSFQQWDDIPQQSHDVKLQFLLTEKKCHCL